MQASSPDSASVLAAVARQPSCTARARFQAAVSAAQACRWRISEAASWCRSEISSDEAGRRLAMYPATAAVNSASDSGSRAMVLDVSPCLREFIEERRLPSGVLGPRDFTPLIRADSIWRWVAMETSAIKVAWGQECTLGRWM